MNKKCFRVIFSKTLQRLVVVSELVKSDGKVAKASRLSFRLSSIFAQIRPLTFSLYCVLGFVAFSDSALANLIIQADKSAPKNTQPIVLQTANGLPQVNIQTPNDKGLSHNKYTQFSVAEKGAILNNSRTNTVTQQAGRVQGNPYLARGEAKVILNEVTSNNPSVLKGYVEVAGKKAEVIIANPSGIRCEGCGVINSDRATLTTGKPQIRNGNLESFVVEKGKVTVSGKGLDNSRVDYTEILAREAAVNAGVWSKKETNVITGKNTAKRSDSGKSLQIIHTKQPLAGEAQPQYALDVSELGGMYSGKIQLIGTEQGVGVRNAGHIGADSQTVRIDSQGKIINQGTINALQQVELTATQGIENQGKIENRQGDIRLNSQGDIHQNGSLVARGGNVVKQAQGEIKQTGETLARGDIDYTSSKLNASPTALIGAGVEIKDSPQGEVRRLAPQSPQGKQIRITVSEKASSQGRQLASGEVNLTAKSIDLSQSQTNAQTIRVQAQQGDIQANATRFTAQSLLSLTTPETLSTQSSHLTANQIQTSQKSLNASNAVWQQTGEDDFRLVGETIRTAGGAFSTAGNFFIEGKRLENTAGSLVGKSLTVSAEQIETAGGQLSAKEQINLASHSLNNEAGLIFAHQNISIQNRGFLNNRQTDAENKGIIAGQQLRLNSHLLDNSQGKVTSRYTELHTDELNNKAGLIFAHQNISIQNRGSLNNQQTNTDNKGIMAGQKLRLESGSLNNQQGKISSRDIRLNTVAELNNNAGGIGAKEKLDLTAQQLTNHQGVLLSEQLASLTVNQFSQRAGRVDAPNLVFKAQQLESSDNSVIVAENLELNSQGQLNNLNNSRIIATQNGRIVTGNILNNQGGILASQADLNINTQGHLLNNSAGNIIARKQLSVQSSDIENNQGLVSGKAVRLAIENRLTNQHTRTDKKDKGIIAQTDLHITSQHLNNDNGNIQAEENLTLSASSLTQQTGLINAKNVDLTVTELTSTQESEMSGTQLSLNANSVNNHNAKLLAENKFILNANGIQNAQGTLAVTKENGELLIKNGQATFNNEGGILSVESGRLDLQTGAINNQQGKIRAQQAVIDTHNQKLDNRYTKADKAQGIIVEDLTLTAGTVDNQQGRISVKGQVRLNAEQLQNQQGELLAKGVMNVTSAKVDNSEGTFASVASNLILTTQSQLNNQAGFIGATNQLQLTTQGLANQNGEISSTRSLVLNTAQQAVENQNGKIFARSRAELNVGELNNQRGLIRADDKLTLTTHGQRIDNRYTKEQGQALGIVGGGEVVLNGVSELLNEQGRLFADKLTLDVAGQTDNRQGEIQGESQLTLTTHSLNNQAGNITATQTGVITASQIENQAVSSQGSLIVGGKLQLTTEQLNNQGTKATSEIPTQGIQATQLDLNVTTLNNQQGGIYSLDRTTIQAKEQVDNQQGELLAGNQLTVQRTGDLILNNQEGLMQAGRLLEISAKGLTEGTIKTKGDLSVALQDNFTLNNAFEVGNNLTFSTEGNFENNSTLIVGNRASFNAKQIVNNKQGELSSQETTLTADQITNRGLIDGTKTRLNSKEITNIGMGRIYGDELAIKAENLNNLQETVDGETKSGTIAAREKFNLGIGTLTNRDNALVLSLGSFAVGGDLDEEGNAVGKAKFIDNGSATIEVLGTGKINTERLLNHDLYLKLGVDTTKEYVHEMAEEINSQRYRVGVDGSFSWNKRSRDAWFDFYDPNKPTIYKKEWNGWEYDRITKTPFVEKSAPAKMSIGQDLILNGYDLTNQNSQLLIGGKLYLNDTVFTENPNNDSLNNGKTQLKNESLKGTIQVEEKGYAYFLQHYRSRNGNHGHRGINKVAYTPPTLELTKDFGLALNTIGVKLNSNAEVEGKVSAKDVSLEEISIRSGQSNLPSFSPQNPTFEEPNKTQIVLTPTLDTATQNQVVSSGQVVGKLDTTVENFELKDFDKLQLPTIKTHLAEISLPQASLYQINPDNPKGYLVETDPKFTQQRAWFSSDYMFNQLRYDHNAVQKRLGDGFYEQQLVNQQINQLTGRRYLEGYGNNLEQYKALMNSGVKYAEKFNLTVGIGLTAKQMSELTTDMVWLVNKDVSLPNGRKVTVLTPQVYLVARDSDITSRGALISANEITGSVDNFKNSGTIAGRKLTQIKSNQAENSGVVLGKNVDLSATQTLVNLDGRIEATDSLVLSAGKKLEIGSTLSSSTSADGNFARTELDRIGSVKVTNKGGVLSLFSDGEVTVKGANVESEGKLFVEGKRVNVGTEKIQNKEHYNANANNYYRLEQSSEQGSRIIGKEGITVIGEGDVKLRQAKVSSEVGKVVIGSRKGDVKIEAGRTEESLASSMSSSSRGLFNKTTEIKRYEHRISNAEGSQLDGKLVSIVATGGKIGIKGSAVVGEESLKMYGKEGVSIESDINTYYQADSREKTKTGLMGTGGIGFSIGKKSEQEEADRTQQSAARSQVGSLMGNVEILTEGHYQQTGSIVTSGKGDVQIEARSANITAARSDYESNYKRTTEQKGLMVALNIPAVQAVQAVASAVKSAKAMGSSKNDRINALGSVNAGFEAMRAAEQVGNLANALSQNPAQAVRQDVSVSITYAQQKSTETQQSQGNQVEKSQINAGGKVSINTTGGGKDSTLTIAGSDISGKGGTHLKAEGKVNIEAVDENHLERSQNKSSGFNAGVAISYGSSGFAFGVTAGGNVAKGYGNGESRAWVGSQVGSKESLTTIESGEETNIIGSQAKGKRIEVAAKDLNIESLQDTAKYEGKQQSASGQVTVGYGASGSASYNQSKMKADYASVNSQAGLFAGDEGYDVNVQNQTNLKGGIITSTQEAEDTGKNRFSTGTLSYSNIENHANYKGSAISASGGISANFETPLGDKGIVQSNKRVKDENGNQVLATGAESLQAGMNLGYGSDSDSQSSQTKSGINTQNIIIRDEQSQLAKTGKTVEQIKAETKTDITTDTAENRSGKLDNNFDKAKLEKELDYQVKATKEFQSITRASINEKISSQAESKRQEAEQAKQVDDLAKASELQKEAEKWETGGAYRQRVDAITNAVGLALGGSPTEGVAVGAVSPYVNTQIKNATAGNDTANLVAHALWGAVEAYSQRGNASSGAIAAVTGEVGAGLISEKVLGKSAEELTETEKRTVSELSQIAAGLASGMMSATTGNSSSLTVVQNAQVGMQLAKNAVENNALGLKDIALYERSLMRAMANGESTEKIHREFKALSEKQRAKLLADCDLDCRIPVINELGAATNRADELTGGLEGVLKDWFGKLSGEEQTRFYRIVEEENQKTIEALKAKQNSFENAVDVALTSVSMFSKENDLKSKGKPVQNNFAKRAEPKNPKPTNKLVSETNIAFEGEMRASYKSNIKHINGKNPNAGIEPQSVLQLFKSSVPNTKDNGKTLVRYSVDDRGNIHRFFGDKNSKEFHWSGSTGDIRNPLKENDIPNEIKKQLRGK